MKRRDFFKKLGIGSIIALAAPKILAKNKVTIQGASDEGTYTNSPEDYSEVKEYFDRMGWWWPYTIERSVDGVNYTKIGETNNNSFNITE